MWARNNAPPDHPDLRPEPFGLCSVHVRDALQEMISNRAMPLVWGGSHFSEVELGILLLAHTLELEERGVGPGVALATLVAEDSPFCVQPVSKEQRILE